MSDFENKFKECRLGKIYGLVDMKTLHRLVMLIGEELIEQQKRLDKLEGGEY